MNTEAISALAQYLTFRLEDETYAIDIGQVQSVLDFERITKVPQTPDFMRGVINLRGSVVPVVDLKLKFGLGETEKTVDSCIIIIEIHMEGELTVTGVLADSVQEVVDMEPQDVEPPPRLGTKINTDFIKGMGKQEDSFVMILNLDKIFSEEDLLAVKAAGDYPEAAKEKTSGNGAADGKKSKEKQKAAAVK